MSKTTVSRRAVKFNRPGTAQVKECVASETAQNGEAKAISPGNARSVSVVTERVRMELREFARQRSLQVKRSRQVTLTTLLGSTERFTSTEMARSGSC